MALFRKPGRRLRFVVLFVLYFVALQRGYLALRTWSDNAVNRHLNAGVSAWVIQQIAPAEQVRPSGTRLVSPRVTLDIMKGCEGFEVMVILVAAMLAYPAPWGKRAAGLVAGCALLYILNVVRLVCLYVVARYRPALFDALHVVFWQSLLVCLGALMFLAWVRWIHRPPRPAG